MFHGRQSKRIGDDIRIAVHSFVLFIVVTQIPFTGVVVNAFEQPTGHSFYDTSRIDTGEKLRSPTPRYVFIPAPHVGHL